MNKLKNKYILIPLAVAILSLIMLLIVNNSGKAKINKTYTEFLGDINNNVVSTVYVTSSPKLKITLKDGTSYETDNPKSITLKEMLLTKGVTVSEKSSSTAKEVIPAVTLGVSLIVMLLMFLKSSSITSKGLLSADSFDAQSVSDKKYNFGSIAGNEEAKESVNDIVDFLKNPEKYSSYGARMPKGIILYGEPGTGKTLMAKAVAGEAGVPFYAMSGSDFVQVYVGVGASRIRSLFKKAKSNGKAVIFIDEIDAIGKARDSGKNGGSDERDQTLNALLTEMSGFNESDGIVVMAATNRLDMLDSALLRPGRFDRHVEISLPDLTAREKILSLHLKNKPAGDINVRDLAHKTAYFSGAKLESLVNEAAILACKEDSGYITDLHLDKAFSIVVAGHEKVNRDSITDTDRRITAYHEAGHALVSLIQLPNEKVSKVTIIPSTKGAGGYTISIPEDTLYHNRTYLINRMMVLLGGRAAEEIIFGKEHVTTGAYSDLKHTTSMITRMATEYGMGETLGLLSLRELSNAAQVNSEELIQECKNVLNSLYEKTKTLLLTERDSLERITSALMEKETLNYDELMQLVKVKN
jgi:cell division protease FtsH